MGNALQGCTAPMCDSDSYNKVETVYSEAPACKISPYDSIVDKLNQEVEMLRCELDAAKNIVRRPHPVGMNVAGMPTFMPPGMHGGVFPPCNTPCNIIRPGCPQPQFFPDGTMVNPNYMPLRDEAPTICHIPFPPPPFPRDSDEVVHKVCGCTDGVVPPSKSSPLNGQRVFVEVAPGVFGVIMMDGLFMKDEITPHPSQDAQHPSQEVSPSKEMDETYVEDDE